MENSTLFIEFSQCTEQLETFDVFISIPELEEIRFLGVGKIEMDDDFDLDELDVNLTGVDDIELAGSADELSLSLVGVGDFKAFDMEADDVDISIMGTGNARVTALQTLDVTITGTGNVFYKGNPTISAQISGTGEIIDAN